MQFINEDNRIYAKNGDGALVAELTYRLKANNVYNIDYTFVDESLRNQGVASKLMEEAVKTMKKKGGKIEATCSYASKWLQEHKV